MYDSKEVKEAIETLINDGVNVKEDQSAAGWWDFVYSNEHLFTEINLSDAAARSVLYEKLEDEFLEMLD